MLKKIFILGISVFMVTSLASAAESISIMIDPDGIRNSFFLYFEDYSSLPKGVVETKKSEDQESAWRQGEDFVKHIQNLISSKGYKVLTFDGQGYGLKPLNGERSEAVLIGVGIGEFGEFPQVDFGEADVLLHIIFNPFIKKWEILLFHLNTEKYIYEEIDADHIKGQLQEAISDTVLSLLEYVPRLSEVKADEILNAKHDKVAYELTAESGENLRMIFQYSSDKPEPTILNGTCELSQVKPDGVYALLVPTEENIPVIFEFTCKNNLVSGVEIRTFGIVKGEKVKGPVTLTAKSKNNYKLVFNFTEQDGKLKVREVRPAISPWDISELKEEYKGRSKSERKDVP